MSITARNSRSKTPYLCTRDWPDNVFLQCGGSENEGSCFFEAFPLKSFIRGEGKTLKDAEDNAFNQYLRILSCPGHEYVHLHNDVKNRYGQCIHCNYFTNYIFKPFHNCIVCNRKHANLKFDIVDIDSFKQNNYCIDHFKNMVKKSDLFDSFSIAPKNTEELDISTSKLLSTICSKIKIEFLLIQLLTEILKVKNSKIEDDYLIVDQMEEFIKSKDFEVNNFVLNLFVKQLSIYGKTINRLNFILFESQLMTVKALYFSFKLISSYSLSNDEIKAVFLNTITFNKFDRIEDISERVDYIIDGLAFSYQ